MRKSKIPARRCLMKTEEKSQSNWIQKRLAGCLSINIYSIESDKDRGRDRWTIYWNRQEDEFNIKATWIIHYVMRVKMLRGNDFDVHDLCFHSSEILKFCFLSTSCTRLYTCRLKQCWVNAWFTWCLLTLCLNIGYRRKSWSTVHLTIHETILFGYY